MPDVSAKLVLTNGKTLEFVGPADITKETTDAIVNAANSSLLGGGGVDGAIHRAGGPSILEECKRIVAEIKYLPEGKAVITTGGRLPAKYVIHTVGPIWHGGEKGEPDLLASCYRRSFEVAVANGVRTIAFPAISAGVYGYPMDKACRIAMTEAKAALQKYPELEKVVFVPYSGEALRIYRETFAQVFG